MDQLRDEIHENFETFLKETPFIHKDNPTEGEEFELLLEKLSVREKFFHKIIVIFVE